VTVDWIEQSVKALEQAEVDLKQVKTPLLVLQSGNDRVIDNAGQDLFCQLLKQSGHPCYSERPIVVEGAEHELLIEQDSMRNKALQQILSFYQN
jgi:lysophospholipase